VGTCNLFERIDLVDLDFPLILDDEIEQLTCPVFKFLSSSDIIEEVRSHNLQVLC
jgi:hypothetical protein